MEQLHVHAVKRISNSELHDSIRKFFAVEDTVVTCPMESDEDKGVRHILETTTVREGARMSTGLLWRNDNAYFLVSYQGRLAD